MIHRVLLTEKNSLCSLTDQFRLYSFLFIELILHFRSQDRQSSVTCAIAMRTFDACYPIHLTISSSIVKHRIRAKNSHFVANYLKASRRLSMIVKQTSSYINCLLFFQEKSNFVGVHLSDISTQKTYTFESNIILHSIFLKRKFSFAVEPDTRVMRDCASNITEIKSECYQVYGHKNQKEICECDQSYCNGANRMPTSIGTLFLEAVLSLGLTKLVLAQLH